MDPVSDEETNGLMSKHRLSLSRRSSSSNKTPPPIVHAPRRIFPLILITLLASICAAFLVLFLPRPSSPPPSALYWQPGSNATRLLERPCGGTPDEARARGCRFDVNSFCWLPDACYDAELSAEFDHYREWRWWRDDNGTQPVAYELVAAGDFAELYVSWGYHLRHCTTMWKKLHRALLRLEEGVGAVDSYVGSYQHTLHCEKMFLGYQGDSFEDINTVIRAKYPDCRILRLEK